MKEKLGLLPTGIGSLPHVEPKEAVDLVFSKLPEIPFWPQLPKRSPKENMYAQYARGLPCARWDEESGKVWFEVADDISSELAEFYERVMADDLEPFALTPEEAAGFFEFMMTAPKLISEQTVCVKGQVTGPISFGLAVTDQNKRAVMYSDELFEAIVEGIAAKARWQVRELKRLGKPVMMFFDEPYLVSVGSAFVSIDPERVKEHLRKVIEAARQEGAITGAHCCANTDWSLLLDSPIDVLSLDAFEYFDNLMLYKDSLADYLGRGGIVALGVVPTDERTFELDVEILTNKAVDQMIRLSDAAGADVSGQIIVTPACGLGSTTKRVAQRALELAAAVAERLREGPLAA